MINLEIEVEGAEEVRTWLSAAPARFLLAVRETARKGGELMQQDVRRNTDVDTGALLASEQLALRDTTFGATANVFSDQRYAGYVERGTKEHGRAQYMFRRGLIEADPVIERIFDYQIRAIVE